jgi:hypothetical protein
MRNMRRLAVLALAVACGCTPMQWHKDGATPEQLRADQLDCRQRAWHEASIRSWQYQSMTGPVFARDGMGGGYFVWPTTPLADPYGYQLMEESRLAQFCLEAKGYALVPTPKP